MRLAIEGGDKIRLHPMPGWPCFSEDEIEASAQVLRSGKVNYWTGQEGRHFEREFAQSTQTEFAITLANGTLALELALLALGIGEGDHVLTTSRTFIASASCAVMRGAVPVMVDVDRETQNVTVATLKAALTPKTKAIIAVHLAGWPCEMDAIMDFAKLHNLYVIEDCAQAQGALYKGRPVGSFGHVNAFSFCQDKIMTTGGEGGMLVTNNQEWWSRAWSYKDHGKDFETVYAKEVKPGFRWLHKSFGTNWRMTDMQSALGRACLKKVPDWVNIRREHGALLNEKLSGISALRLTIPGPDIFHSYYRFYCFVEPSKLRDGWDRDRVMNAVCAEGVPCFSGSCSEVYLEDAFVKAGYGPEKRLLVSEELGRTSLAFLVHPTLSAADVADVGRAVEKVMQVASR